MSEWWTYRASSFLLFSPRTWFRLHELYNREIWPAQLVALALGIIILILLRRPGGWRGRAVLVMLAVCWLWVAWAYHVRRYATINWVATYFAAAFAVEALLLLWTGIISAWTRLEPTSPSRNRTGFCVVAFALVVQPAIGPLLGRSWQQSEVFGVAPDPTVVLTLGVLLLARGLRWPLAIIPLLWCAVSGAFQWAMRTPDALLMPLIGVAVVLIAAMQRTASSREAGASVPGR